MRGIFRHRSSLFVLIAILVVVLLVVVVVVVDDDVVAVDAAPSTSSSTTQQTHEEVDNNNYTAEKKKKNHNNNDDDDHDNNVCKQPPPENNNNNNIDTENGSSSSSTKARKTEENENDNNVNEPKSLPQFFMAFRRLGTSWKQFVLMYKDSFGNAMGQNYAADIWEDNINDGVIALRNIVNEKLKAGQEVVGNSIMWTFRSVPYEQFNCTIDDIYIAFLRWSQVDGTADDIVSVDDNTDQSSSSSSSSSSHSSSHSSIIGKNINNQKTTIKVNVSKALRRLEAYAQWMESNYQDLTLGPTTHHPQPLTASSIRHAYDVFNMRISYDDIGRLVWWFDNGQINFDKVHSLPKRDVLRLFVWFAHLIMFDGNAQQYGIVVVDNLAKIGFWNFMHMMPVDVGLQIDNFIISLWPLKKKRVLMTQAPKWFDIMYYKIIGIFIPSKMKVLVEIVPDNHETKIIQDRVGVQFATGMIGHLEEDLIATKYFSRD